jgi:hypothetical protein
MSAAAAAGAAAAAIANAIKASGVVVRVQPEDFVNIVRKVDKPLIIQSEGGIFSKNYQYLASYKGFAFFTRSSQPIQFASGVEIVMAKKIWIPG